MSDRLHSVAIGLHSATIINRDFIVSKKDENEGRDPTLDRIKDAYNRQPVKLREEQNLAVNWLARLKGVGGNRHTGEPG